MRQPPERLRSLQDRLLRDAVAHAHGNVPFYRRFWNEGGFDATHFAGLSDLTKIPMLTADTLKALPEAELPLITGLDPGRATHLDSSGSSGKKLRIWKSPVEERVRRAVGLRIWFEHGFRWGHTTAQFQVDAGASLLLQRFGISRKVWISTVLPIGEQKRRFLEAKADVVVGTPTALRRLAYALSNSGMTPKQPTVIFGAGELMDEETIAIVRQVLGREPVAIYGQTEVGYIAWQCEERGAFHVSADTHLVEVWADGRPAAPGELGQVVITDLTARTMPFLRYATGDWAVAAAEPCACGASLPIIASIEGRDREAIPLANGNTLTMRTVINHASKCLRLGAYRLHRLSADRFRLELADGALVDETADDAEAVAVKHLQQLLGDVDIKVDHVAPWRPTGTGKTKTIVA
jgi:phenylacetate-CoA ligase